MWREFQFCGVGLFTAILLVSGCKTQVELDETRVWHRGHPVFSDDGSDFAFVEKTTDERLIFPPLQGWVGRTNPRFAVRLGNSQEDGQSILHNVPGHALDVFYMRRNGYVVANFLRQPEEERGAIVVDLSGRERGRIRDDIFGFNVNRFVVVPSRDGHTIAAVGFATDYSMRINGKYRIRIGVQFYEAANLNPSSMHELNVQWSALNDIQAPIVFWDDAGSLLLTDNQTETVSVDVGGSVQVLGVPTCYRPMTSSSRYRAQSAGFLEFSHGQIIERAGYIPPVSPICP